MMADGRASIENFNLPTLKPSTKSILRVPREDKDLLSTESTEKGTDKQWEQYRCKDSRTPTNSFHSKTRVISTCTDEDPDLIKPTPSNRKLSNKSNLILKTRKQIDDVSVENSIDQDPKLPNSSTSLQIQTHEMSGLLVDNHLATGLPEYAGLQRLQEKRELQDLNTRVTNYIGAVRNIREQGQSLDSSAFVHSVQNLEDEITNLKNMYETELENLRRQLDDLSREKSHFKIDANKHYGFGIQLQDQLLVETDKNRELHDQLNQLQRKLAEKETDLVETRLALNKPIDDLTQTQRDYDGVYRENQDLKRRYEHEQLTRQEAEDKVHQLNRKLEFQETISKQHVNELKDRLEISANNILVLENKIRDISSQSDSNVPELLTRVREQAEWEVARYREESEANFNREVENMKVQLDINARNTEAVRVENNQLHMLVDDLNSTIRQLQTLATGLESQKRSLEDTIDIERRRSQEHTHTLEKKLRDLTDQLFSKMREANTQRDMHLPLGGEIESLRAMLEEEEKRLRLPLNAPRPMTHTVIPPLASTFASTNLPPLSSYNMPPLNPVYTNPTVCMYDTPPPIENTGITSNPQPLTSTPQAPKVDLDGWQPSTPEPLRVTSPQLEDVQRIDMELTDTVADLLTADDPTISSRPLGPVRPIRPTAGPVRVRSAPATTRMRTKEQQVPTYLGQGKDYFDEMFNDLNKTSLTARPNSSPVRQQSSTSHDYTTATSSATGALKILDVNQDGKFIQLINSSEKVDEEIGGYMIQQNVGGHPVAVFRFPPRTTFQANRTIKVWSGSNDPILHQPPSDFVWKEQEKWGTGPECTTILCKPNGQAVAWTTAAHRFTKDPFEELSTQSQGLGSPVPVIPQDQGDSDMEEGGAVITQSLSELNVDLNSEKTEPVFLRREKTAPPSLSAQRHPYGGQVAGVTHPNSSALRPLSLGNDNSTVNRQSRSQTTRPDPIAGQPYAGASGQRLGSAPLRRFAPCGGPSTTSSRKQNKSAGTIRVGPPSPFMSPLQQDYAQAYQKKQTALARF